MFDNIGSKLKSLAKVLFGLGFLIGLIMEIGLGKGFIIWGLLTILSSWITSALMYGFGELIEKTDITNQELADIVNALRDIEDKIK